MRTVFAATVLLLAACSSGADEPEVPVQQMTEDEAVEVEMEAKAQSLEEAADEAVKILEADIAADAEAEGN